MEDPDPLGPQQLLVEICVTKAQSHSESFQPPCLLTAFEAADLSSMFGSFSLTCVIMFALSVGVQ